MNQDNRNGELERRANRLSVEYPVPRQGPEIELVQDDFNDPPEAVLVQADKMSSAWIKAPPWAIVDLGVWR